MRSAGQYNKFEAWLSKVPAGHPGLIEGQNLDFLKKNGGYFSQNNKAVMIEKKIEDNNLMGEQINGDGLISKTADTRKEASS